MRSKPISMRMPWIVVERLERIARETGYEDLSALLMAGALILIQNDVRLTMMPLIANASPKMQDELIKRVLDLWDEMTAMAVRKAG